MWNKIFELLKVKEDIEFTGKYFRYRGFNQKDYVMVFDILESPVDIDIPILYLLPKNYKPFMLIYRSLQLGILDRITYDIRNYFGDI